MTQIPNLAQIKTYFDKRVQEYGASPKGADWNGEESQIIRFDQLLKVIEGNQPFSLLDYGCGYGALAEYLADRNHNCEYLGFDILESAIETARKTHTGKPHRKFVWEKRNLTTCDYVVASGIFNFRGDHSFDSWTEYVVSMLGEFNHLSRRGFACNFLTKYSDQDKKRNDLYYADPLYLFDYCKRNFSREVALLHDYRLFDFTIIVRKN